MKQAEICSSLCPVDHCLLPNWTAEGDVDVTTSKLFVYLPMPTETMAPAIMENNTPPVGFGFIPYQEATLKDVPMREARMNHEGIWLFGLSQKTFDERQQKHEEYHWYLKVYQVDQVAGSV